MSANTAYNLRFLDGLRGLAAFYVMVGHARWLLWEGVQDGYQKHPELYNILDKTMMYGLGLFRYGHEAVLFFFVLSGFVIHLKYSKHILREGENTPFALGDYLLRRVRRIYPPLLAALCVTGLLDYCGASLLGLPVYSRTTPYTAINQNIHHFLDIKTLLGNLCFFTETYVPFYGSNGPLWSLKFEWWFYMFYPLFFLLTKRSISVATGALAMLFVLSFFPAFFPIKLLSDVFSMMLLWWFGVLLADVFTGRIQGVSFGALSILIVAIPLALLKPTHHTILLDSIWAVGFVGLLSACFALQTRGFRLVILEKLDWLGNFSYTLYAVHFPILVFLSGCLMQYSTDKMLPHHSFFVLLALPIPTIIAYFLYFLVEKPFITVRK